jgi:hypothetical protein
MTTIPHTLQEVLCSTNQDQWLTTMCCEYNTLMENNIFNLVKLPAGHRAVSTQWILKVKSPSIYKAHFVAHGFSQKPGVDYD